MTYSGRSGKAQERGRGKEGANLRVDFSCLEKRGWTEAGSFLQKEKGVQNFLNPLDLMHTFFNHKEGFLSSPMIIIIKKHGYFFKAWYLILTIQCYTVEPRYNEPLCNKAPSIRNDILQPRECY